MLALIIGMLLCVGLALAVVALVAVPARREGRELLSPQGEEIMAAVKDKTESTIEKTGDALTSSKDKASDPVQPEPTQDSGHHRAAS
ncbi:MAG: hypothetical protein ABIQ13_15455 [Pedococcus sp.]